MSITISPYLDFIFNVNLITSFSEPHPLEPIFMLLIVINLLKNIDFVEPPISGWVIVIPLRISLQQKELDGVDRSKQLSSLFNGSSHG